MSVQVLLLRSLGVLLLPPPVNFGSSDDNLDPLGAERKTGLNLFGPPRAQRSSTRAGSALYPHTERERSLWAPQASIAAGLKSAARDLAPTWDPSHQVSVDNHDVPPVGKTAHSEHHNTTLCSLCFHVLP